jgi:cullin 1
MQLCKGELKTNFGDGKGYTFQVSTYQMGILLAYNTKLVYSLEELMALTGMNQDSISGNLGLLCKAKLLIEASAGERKEYSLNTDFKSKKLRMNLNIAIKSEAKAEVDETHKTIEKDRELVIQVFDKANRRLLLFVL